MKKIYAFLLLTALGSCESKPQTAAIAEAPVTPASAAAPRPSVAGVLGDYEGTMGGKYPFRLSITAQKPDSQLVGIYYYLSQHKPIELQGFVAPTGEIRLREFGSELLDAAYGVSEAEDELRQPFARFMVRRTPDGALAGVWQKADSDRRLPVQLTRYRPRGFAQKAHVAEQVYFEEFTVPVFTVPDPGVTRLLHEIFGIEALTDLTLAELREEHRNHANGTVQGLAGVDTEVTYNDQGLLSVELHSEYTAANVSHSYRSVVFDLRTGQELGNEIAVGRQAEFRVLCEQKLQQQIAAYVAEEYPDAAPDSADEDLAGLRSQHIGPATLPAGMRITATGVSFHYPVQYEAMWNLMFKQFQNLFWLNFSLAELRPLLKPNSPLRRLGRR